jgi:hypothetical protein
MYLHEKTRIEMSFILSLTEIFIKYCCAESHQEKFQPRVKQIQDTVALLLCKKDTKLYNKLTMRLYSIHKELVKPLSKTDKSGKPVNHGTKVGLIFFYFIYNLYCCGYLQDLDPQIMRTYMFLALGIDFEDPILEKRNLKALQESKLWLVKLKEMGYYTNAPQIIEEPLNLAKFFESLDEEGFKHISQGNYYD